MPFANIEDKRLYDKEYARLHKEKIKKYKIKYYQENKNKCNLASHDWAESNRDKTRISVENWRQVNKSKKALSEEKRRKAQKNRTPLWSDVRLIEDFYRNRPEEMEVDHIIPLQGKLVSGLHIIENLQYLSKDENSRKGHKFPI